jgi:F0F1-type ATP synthase assembly protein I
MVVPGLLGYWADSHLGTGFLFLILGMTLGVTVGIWQLVRLTQVADSQAKQRSEVSDDSNESQGTGTQK